MGAATVDSLVEAHDFLRITAAQGSNTCSISNDAPPPTDGILSPLANALMHVSDIGQGSPSFSTAVVA